MEGNNSGSHDGVTFEIGAHKVLPSGFLRFELIIPLDKGHISIDGFRYDPDKDEILMPSFRGSKGGYLPIVRLGGPWTDDLHEQVRKLAVRPT